ncbi:MAG: hypothetical protein GX612_01195 [Bacteroidales bacterium]|nr:hypothetical protein [Bacteroidales bacterium]
MLKQLYFNYIKKLLIFTVFLLVIEVVFLYVFPQLISSNFVYLLLLFLLFTAGSHYIVVRTDVKRIEFKPDPSKTKEEQMKDLMAIERKFISNYMLITVAKLLLFLTIILIYSLINKPDMLRFSLNFLVLYLLYSVFEIIVIKKPILK